MRQFLKYHLPKDTRAKLLRVERFIKLFTHPRILADLNEFNKQMRLDSDERFTTKIKDIFPVAGENTKYTSFDRHYVYHTSWAARVVKEISEVESAPFVKEEDEDKDALPPKPRTTPFKHIDISSSLYFSGVVSAFVPVEFYDYRPADLRLEGLSTHTGDLMRLPFADKSVESISCLHTIEHVGLGRYGDPIDPLGDVKAITDLMRVVAPNGNLLIVVPVGRQRIEFNAHRIYSPTYIKDLVCQAGEFKLKEYASFIINSLPLNKPERGRFSSRNFV